MKNNLARQTITILSSAFIIVLLAFLFIVNTMTPLLHQEMHQQRLAAYLVEIFATVDNVPADKTPQLINELNTPIVHVMEAKKPLKGAEQMVAPDIMKMHHWIRRHPHGGDLSFSLGSERWINLEVNLPRFHDWWLITGFGLVAFILILAFIALCVWAVHRLMRPTTELSNNLLHDRTQMLAAISHDLRTPITRLKLRVEYLQDSEQYQKILADLDEMEAMLTAVLSFARDDARHDNTEHFDLNALLDSVCNDMSDTGFAVTYNGGEKRLPFTGDINNLKRAFSNLIGNAVKYGGQADVRLYCGDKQIKIEIDDRGPGIPDTDLERVFTPFYRVEQSRSRETGGTGLGLTVARDIIRSYNGEIELRNLSQGGLRVKVMLRL
ncbi:MAG: HAMP domain-containing histidine kinase [Gammaproteobacteria bacterium]|nr:HAMP domain-containing histidine kinase [Gammaproteobacteria bacterium]